MFNTFLSEEFKIKSRLLMYAYTVSVYIQLGLKDS